MTEVLEINSYLENVISFPQDTKKERVEEESWEGNYRSHKAEDIVKEAERLGVELVFLPPYSPDL